MKPAPFDYHVPSTLPEALELLGEYGLDGKPLAGGQSLVPTMNFRLAQPAVLVDLNNVAELFYIRPQDQGVAIGAMTRQRTVERSDMVAQRAPLIRQTMQYIAHPQIRNRGTFGGSLAHADPAAELPAVAVALNARFRVRSVQGERWIDARDFYVDFFATDLQPGELLVEVVVPTLPSGSGWGFDEVARQHGNYAMAGAAAMVTLGPKGHCQQVKLVFLSVGDGPVEAEQAQESLLGEKPGRELIEAAASLAAQEDIDPPGDIHASTAYRRHLARAMAERALSQAMARAREELATGT